jgi:TatD DNase family protein
MLLDLIDIGANLTHAKFKNDLDAILERAEAAGVHTIILTGTSVRNSQEAAQLAKRYPHQLYATAGVHPHDAKSWNADSGAILRKLLEQPQVVSVGECGLDFDRDFSPRPVQAACFEAQLQIAIDTQKSLFLHERAAHERFVEIVQPHLSQLPKAVVHCFTGTYEEAKKYLDMGFYIGITGAISDSRRFEHLQTLLPKIPLNRLMIETDAPFMCPRNLPTRVQDNRNEPAFLEYVLRFIAQCVGKSAETVAEATSDNARLFFGIG